MNNLNKAIDILEKGLELSKKYGITLAKGYILMKLGMMYFYKKNFKKTRECYDAALNLTENHRLDELKAIVLSGIGFLNAYNDNPQEAVKLLKESLSIQRKLGLSNTREALATEQILQLIIQGDKAFKENLDDIMTDLNRNF